MASLMAPAAALRNPLGFRIVIEGGWEPLPRFATYGQAPCRSWPLRPARSANCVQTCVNILPTADSCPRTKSDEFPNEPAGAFHIQAGVEPMCRLAHCPLRPAGGNTG